MEIWIIRDGEKSGPFHDFEIRRQIETGTIAASTPAWHEGQAEWKPLGEIDLFQREFDIAATHREEEREAALPVPETAAKPPPLPIPAVYGRRFWARWFDLWLYSGVWWFGIWLAGQDIGATILNPWVMFFQYVPWFVFEAILIHYLGTTPGKWLLGLKVENLDGSSLELGPATRRSGRVLFTGIGFGWIPLSIFCQTLSYFTAKRLGTSLWDHLGGHRVAVSPLSPVRLITFAAILFGAIQLQMLVISPFVVKFASEQYPEAKKFFEHNPPWQLPVRSKPE